MAEYIPQRFGLVGLIEEKEELGFDEKDLELEPDSLFGRVQKALGDDNAYMSFNTYNLYLGLLRELINANNEFRDSKSGCAEFPIIQYKHVLDIIGKIGATIKAEQAIRDGACEIDMVINIGALKSRDYSHVLEDIRQVVEASRPYPVKVILETAELNHDEKAIACALSKAAGAAFVKTSTGFGSGGATAEDIELMRRVVGPEMGVKASGGIRTFEDADRMIKAGATRIGASASIAIVTRKSEGDKQPGKGKAAGSKPFKSGLY